MLYNLYMSSFCFSFEDGCMKLNSYVSRGVVVVIAILILPKSNFRIQQIRQCLLHPVKYLSMGWKEMALCFHLRSTTMHPQYPTAVYYICYTNELGRHKLGSLSSRFFHANVFDLKIKNSLLETQKTGMIRIHSLICTAM